MAAALRPPPFPLFAARRSARSARSEFVLDTSIEVRRRMRYAVRCAGRAGVGHDLRIGVHDDPRSPPLLGDHALAVDIVIGRRGEAVARAGVARGDHHGAMLRRAGTHTKCDNSEGKGLFDHRSSASGRLHPPAERNGPRGLRFREPSLYTHRPGEVHGMELFGLSGRVSIITGGNGGIGLGMAKGMACAGAAVVLAGRDEAKNAAAGSNLSSIRLASGTPFS